MAENNFIFRAIATLKKAQTKKQVQSDAKNLGDIYVPLIGKLNKSKTKAQLKQDLASLNGTVNLTGKVNKKGIVTSVQQATQQAQTVANKKPIQVGFNLKKEKLINDIKVFGQLNSKMMKDANMAAKYNSLLDNAKLATSNKEIQNLRLQLSAMRSEIKATNLSGLTLGDTFKKTFKRATELFASTGGIMLLTRQIRQAWTEALNLDKAYTDLIKVQNDLSRGDYPEYLERCNKKAQELATTQKSLIEGATEFSKSGYTKSQSDALTEKSTILANVGEMSASDSAKAIISGVQAYDVVDGYDDVIDKAGALIDKYNEIGNTASITTAEIAQGVQSVGSVFADANTSVDEFIALLAAGNRQYQDADALALGLRTAALRIRGCKVELGQMGEETEGVYTSASKLAEKIEGLTNINGNGGVKILEADGETFRSIYDIFLDISKVYKDMSDVDQSVLLELIAGKHRASAISATISNMSESTEIYERSLNSAGSAQREYDKYLESSEASLNRFKSSMTETYQSVIDGETVTGLLNCGNATLQFVNSLGLVESTLKGLVAIGIVKAITTLSTAFKASAIQASNFGTALNTVKNMSIMTRSTTEYTNALKTLKTVSAGLSDTQLRQVLANKALSDSDRIAILCTTGLTRAQAQAKLAQMGLTHSTNAQTTANTLATASTFSLTAAIKGYGVSLKAAFMSNPIGISIMALSMVIGAVTNQVNKYKEKIEESREKFTELSNTWREHNTSLAKSISQYKELNAKLHDNSLSTEEVKSLKEQLTSIQDDLNQKYGEEANNIDLVNGKYDEQIVKLDELSKKKARDYIATNADNVKSDKEYLSKVISGDNTTDIARYQTNLGNDEQEKQYKEAEKIYKKYLKKYEALSLSYDYFKGTTGLRLNLKGTREEIQTQLSQLFSELNEDYKGNPPEFIQGLKDVITETLNMDDFDTTKIEDAKNNIKAYTEAEILANSKTRNLYNDSIDAVEKYNNALAEGKGINAAKKNLDDIKQKVSESIKGYEGYDAVFNDIFDAARETDNKIKEVTEQTSILSKSFSEAFNSEDYKEVSQELLKLAEAGELNPNVLDGVSKYTSLLEETGLTAQQASDRINKMVDSTTRLAATTSNISQLSDAYKEFQENGHNSMTSLSKLQSAFGKLDGYDDFIKVAGSASSSAEDIQKAYNNLCSEYINGTGILDTVNKSNKDLIKTQLEAVGVTNAETIVNNALNKGMTELNTNTLSLNDAKQVLLNNSLKLATVTAQEIQGLINEGVASRDTAEKIALFALKKQLANGITINTIGDIQALAKLANVAQKTINLMDGVAKLQKLIDSGQIYGSAAEAYKNSIQTDLNSINDEVNKKIGQNAQINTATISSVPDTSGSKGKSKSSGSSKKKKEPIDKFNDWLNKLFDFMEIKLSKQESKIEKYTNRAENAMDKGNYSKSAINYRNAIKATNVQIDNEGDAQKLYNSTANKVLKKAVSLGVINQDKAKQIVKDVNNGSVAVKKYSKNVQAVVDAYKQWKDKADSAKDSLSDLTDKTRGYAKSLKELRDTQRDAKIAKIDNSTSFIGAFGSNQYSAKSQNAQLSFEISKLNANSKAYNTEVNTVKSDIKKSSSSLLSSLSKKIQKNKKKSEYVKALKRAKNNIKSMKKVSSSDLKIIKKYSSSTYNNVLSYNMQLDNLETAKEERNLAVALNKSEIYEKIAEKYDNISAEHDNNISLYEKRMSNSNNAGEIQSNAQAILNEMNAKDTNRQNEINSYNNTISSSKTSIASLVGVNSKLKGKAYATVKALVDRIKSCVSSGTSISDADLNSLNTYASKGYISIQFLDAATNYQMALIRKEEAVVEDMMQDEEDKAKRAELGNMMFNASKIATQNALDNNENRRSLLQSQQAYKTGSGLKLSASDYDNLISINNQDVVTYGIQKAAMIAARDYNVASGLWAVGDENWTNASKTIDQLDTSIQNLVNDTQELNNTKLNLQIENQKEYIETLEIVKDFYDSFLEVAEATGKTLTEADYGQSIEALKNSKKEYENLRKTYGEYYNLALNSGGTYAGKSANEWADLYNQAVANVNKKEVEIQNLHDQAWKANLTIYEKVNEEIERTKSLLEGVKGLLDSDTFVNKDGKLTDFGKVDLALGMKEFNENIRGMESARAEYEEIQRGYANKTGSYAYMSEDEYKEVLNKTSQELLNYYSDNKSIVSNAYSTIQSVMQAELDALKKVIDKRKEALQAKKDYYDYDKTIKNKTKDIQSLQSQIDALAGIDGAEAKSKMAQLKAELADKQSDFEDTIQEHTYNLQVNALDELSETLQDDLDARLELLKTDFAEIIKLAGDLSASQSVTNSVLSNILTTLGGDANDGNKIGVTDISDSNKTIQSSKKTLSSLKKVDSLVPIQDMKSLVDLNTMTMDLYSLQHTMPKFEPVERNNVTNITYNHDLIVEGNVDKYVVDDLKKLYEDSYKYTTQKMYAEARKSGRC